MKKSEIVKILMAAIEKNNFDEALKYLSDDFVFTGPTPKALNKNEWLDLHKMINQGFPDFSFNLSNVNENGKTVNGTVKLSGTQSKDLPPLIDGVPPVPATNKKVQLPKEDFTATFAGDKISKLTVEKVPNGGVPELLKQLGARVPSFLG